MSEPETKAALIGNKRCAAWSPSHLIYFLLRLVCFQYVLLLADDFVLYLLIRRQRLRCSPSQSPASPIGSLLELFDEPLSESGLDAVDDPLLQADPGTGPDPSEYSSEGDLTDPEGGEAFSIASAPSSQVRASTAGRHRLPAGSAFRRSQCSATDHFPFTCHSLCILLYGRPSSSA